MTISNGEKDILRRKQAYKKNFKEAVSKHEAQSKGRRDEEGIEENNKIHEKIKQLKKKIKHHKKVMIATIQIGVIMFAILIIVTMK